MLHASLLRHQQDRFGVYVENAEKLPLCESPVCAPLLLYLPELYGYEDLWVPSGADFDTSLNCRK